MTTIGSAVLYQLYFEETDEAHKISSTTLYAVVGSLAASWIFSFALFLRIINPSYISTFFSVKTGRQFTIDSFKNGDDFQKHDIFTVNRRHWSTIVEEVKQWTHESWARWELEKPEFFNDGFVSKVPNEFIPEEFIPRDRRRPAHVKGTSQVAPL